ncbi:MAG: ABC transporter permease [Pseudorhodobacter sp.]
MAYILQRLLYGLVVIFCALTLAFLLAYVIGDPVLMYVGADAPAEVVDEYRRQLGFDRPVYVQYFEFMGGVLQGDLGQSYRQRAPVMPILLERLGYSAELAIPAILLAVLVSVPVGVLSAVRRNSLSDYVARTGALVGQAAPSFWIGLMAIFFFSSHLGWLPSSGRAPPGSDILTRISHMVMPVVVLALMPLAYLTRIMRSSVLEVISEDYIRTARAKGLSERRVIVVHAVRNALIPYVTLLALQFGWILAGSMVIESVFAWPGMGRLLMDSIRLLDIPVIAAGLSTVAVIFVLLNLIADILYTVLDPRVAHK